MKHVTKGHKIPDIRRSISGNKFHEEIEETSTQMQEEAPILCEQCCEYKKQIDRLLHEKTFAQQYRKRR